MAAGIRIQPALDRRETYGDFANRLVILRDVSRPLKPHPQQAICRICGHPHDYKTYHFQLDAEGTIIVSTTIWERLLAMPDHGGFEKINVVEEPPTQHMALRADGK
jgi:hypothetical protein